MSSDTDAPDAARAMADPFPSSGRPLRHWGYALLLLALVIQLAPVVGRLNEPFVDGRMHHYFDSANFLRRAVHSLDARIDNPYAVLGLSTYTYDAAGVPNGWRHYSHHGVVLPMWLRACVQVLGPHEASIRVATLLIAMLCTALVFGIVRHGTGHPGLAGALATLYVLLPLNLSYVDVVKYEHAVELALLSCVYLLLRAERAVWARRLFPVAVGFAFMTEFSAFIPLGVLWCYLCWQRKQPAFGKMVWPTLALGSAGVLGTMVVQWQLGFDAAEIRDMFLLRAGEGVDRLGVGAYAVRQLRYLHGNLGLAALCALVVAAVVVLHGARRRCTPLAAGALAIFFGGLFWVAVMRNHSAIHHYAQWQFLAPVPLLLAATGLGPGRALGPWRRVPYLLLIPATAWSAHVALISTQAQRIGTAEDIASLRSLERRVVYLPGVSGPPGWWSGPVVRLYRDPVYAPRTGGTVKIEDLDVLETETDLLVMFKQEHLKPVLRTYVREHFGMALEYAGESETFVYYLPRAPAGSAP